VIQPPNVVTAEHDGDAEVFLSRTEFAELQQKLAEIQPEP
jgi:hypothetical protein